MRTQQAFCLAHVICFSSLRPKGSCISDPLSIARDKQPDLGRNTVHPSKESVREIVRLPSIAAGTASWSGAVKRMLHRLTLQGALHSLFSGVFPDNAESFTFYQGRLHSQTITYYTILRAKYNYLRRAIFKEK